MSINPIDRPVRWPGWVAVGDTQSIEPVEMPELVGNDSVLAVIDALMGTASRSAGLLGRYVGQADSRWLGESSGAASMAGLLRHRYRLTREPPGGLPTTPT